MRCIDQRITWCCRATTRRTAERAYRRERAAPVRTRVPGQADEHELARAGRPPARIGGTGPDSAPRRSPRRSPGTTGKARDPPARGPASGLSFGLIHPRPEPFTGERGLPYAQVRYTRGRRWMTLRSPRKRVRGQPLRGFKSHLHRRCDVARHRGHPEPTSGFGV